MKTCSITMSLVLVALAATACSPPYRPAVTGPEPAAPAKIEHEADLFEGSGGVFLFEQFWRPRATPKGVLVIVHGLMDHSSRYATVAERLVSEGYAVYAFDLRGHAHSEGVRVYVGSFDEYLADLDVFMRRVRAREGKRPLFLFGHSMGGAIATLYTITRKPDIQGLALSGAALKADVPAPVKFGSTVLGTVLPESGILNLDLKAFSRDPAVLADNENDPLVYHSGAPARTAKELLGAIGQIQERMQEPTVPLFIMHGAADKVTLPEGSKELKERARSTDKTLKLYPGLYHDLLHEPEREQVTRDLLAWMNAHATPAPAATH